MDKTNQLFWEFHTDSKYHFSAVKLFLKELSLSCRSAATSHTGADSTTEETTAEETTETDSQAPNERNDYGGGHRMQQQQQM